MYHSWSGIQELQYLVFPDRSAGRFQGLTHYQLLLLSCFARPSHVLRA